MLRRMLADLLLVVGLISAGLVAMPAPSASADGGYCTDRGFCTVSGTVPGSSGSGGGSGSSGSTGSSSGNKSSGGKRVCKIDGKEVPCEGDDGSWSKSRQSWCKKLDPQPPLSDPAWGGKTEGAIYRCVRPNNFSDQMVPDAGMATIEWFPSEAAVPAPPPDPEVLARRIVAGMGLQPVDIGSWPEAYVPGSKLMGTVKVPVALWVADQSPVKTGPILSSASERGYTVHARAEMVKTVWDLGDGGAKITCGLGVAIAANAPIETKPVCGRMEGYSKEGDYTITATSYWRVTWNGIGQSGVIELELDAAPVNVRVGEIQTLIRTNPNR